MMPVIETKDLSLWYGQAQALKSINLQVQPSIITSLIGPSGCGKTTLLRCFNRINEHYTSVKTTGEVHVFGSNIYGAGVSLIELRKTVGMVFQRPNPLPISIYENVVFGLRIHSDKPAKAVLDEAVSKALQEVGLPELILLDEPCSTLDMAGTRAIEELLAQLRGRYTLLMVTHNMAQARRASDECLYMFMGEVVEHRRTADLFENPRDERTKQYVSGHYG